MTVQVERWSEYGTFSEWRIAKCDCGSICDFLAQGWQ